MLHELTIIPGHFNSTVTLAILPVNANPFGHAAVLSVKQLIGRFQV
jgi:hypothetical protein